MKLPPIRPQAIASAQGWRSFLGLWLFERDDDPGHLYRAIPRRHASFVSIAMASKFFPEIKRTDYRIRVGNENCEVVQIRRLPFQVRPQECTRKQVLQLLQGMVDFVIESILVGYVPADIHEGNCCWWNGPVFVDLDAYKPLNNSWAAMAFVRIGYLLYRYVFHRIGHQQHRRVNLEVLRQLGGWMGTRPDAQDYTDLKLWQELRRVLGTIKLDRQASHWADAYATTGGHAGKLAAVADLVPSASTLLDLGANKGYVTAMLADRFGYALGVDIDEACVDDAIKNYARPGLNFAKVDLSAFGHDEPVPIHTRYHADVVLALALTHHLDRAGYPLDYITGLFARLARKWLIVENIVHVPAYSKRLRVHGFEVVRTVPSFPAGRTLTLWKKN